MWIALILVILSLVYTLLYYFWKWICKEKNIDHNGFSVFAALLSFVTGTILLAALFYCIVSSFGGGVC